MKLKTYIKKIKGIYTLIVNNEVRFGSYYVEKAIERALEILKLKSIVLIKPFAKKIKYTKNNFNLKQKNEVDIKQKTKKVAIKTNEVTAEVKNIELGFRSPSNPNIFNKVIRNASFKVHKGEVLGIIGESGSGKSVISSVLYGLTGTTSKIISGSVIIKGQHVEKFNQNKWEKSKLRGKIVSAVFQNPMTTLNPTMKIGKQIAESILINKIVKKKKAAYELALEYLRKTKINKPEMVMNMYPHNLSGGMKQRVVIASIVACKPQLIIFDEPTTSLDPTVQAEILEIIKDLVLQTGVSAIFITHDLGVVASIADRVCIMYAGQIVEKGTTSEILFNPQHPYTWGLLTSMPDVNHGKRLKTIPGAVPSNLNKIKWDAFADRNEFALGIDFNKEPPEFKITNTHFVKTWLLDKRAPKVEPPQIIKERWKRWKVVNND